MGRRRRGEQRLGRMRGRRSAAGGAARGRGQDRHADAGARPDTRDARSDLADQCARSRAAAGDLGGGAGDRRAGDRAAGGGRGVAGPTEVQRSLQRPVLQRERRHERQQRAQLAPLAGDTVGVGAAVRAGAHVASQAAAQQRRAASGRELFADLAAVRVTRRAVGDELRAGLVDERLDLLGADAEHPADLAVAEAVDLRQHERRPLGLGEVAQALEHAADLLVELEVVGGARARRDVAGQLDHRPAATQHRQALVARDREQPGT